MDFCATAFGAVEQVRRPGPDGSPIYIAMRINGAFLVVQSEFPDVIASRAPARDGSSPLVIFVYVADVDHAVERAAAMGARILMPAQNQFWGDRTARILDPSGHVWPVASRLVACRETGFDIVGVLGHVRFYPRFGFTRAKNHGLSNEYNASDSFMVLELRQGSRGDRRNGEVRSGVPRSGVLKARGSFVALGRR
jgi:PhnB protein